MTSRPVIFSRRSRADLRALLLYIGGRGGPATAVGYVERIESFCARLDPFPERGRSLADGTRLLAFEDSATVRIRVTRTAIRILRA